jgi:hypothetical protein
MKVAQDIIQQKDLENMVMDLQIPGKQEMN